MLWDSMDRSCANFVSIRYHASSIKEVYIWRSIRLVPIDFIPCLFRTFPWQQCPLTGQFFSASFVIMLSENRLSTALVNLLKRKNRYEPFRFAILRTSVALVSIAFLVAFAWDLVKQIIDEQFSTRGYTVVQPFNNVTKFGMVGMPSILVITNILGHPTFENVSVAYTFKSNCRPEVINFAWTTEPISFCGCFCWLLESRSRQWIILPLYTVVASVSGAKYRGPVAMEPIISM